MPEKFDTFTYEGCIIDDTFAEMLPIVEITPTKLPIFSEFTPTIATPC
jgi:hypothetical protein